MGLRSEPGPEFAGIDGRHLPVEFRAYPLEEQRNTGVRSDRLGDVALADRLLAEVLPGHAACIKGLRAGPQQRRGAAFRPALLALKYPGGSRFLFAFRL